MDDRAADPNRIFAQIDQSEFAAALVEYLEQAAAHPYVRRWHEVALDRMDLAAGMSVLDAGCGPGGAARDIAERVGPDGHVTAIDVSEQMIFAARERDQGRTSVEYRVADVTDLPFATGTFDRTRCERVLQHLDDPDAAIAELVRVSAPNGLVCVLDVDWASFVVDIEDAGLAAWLQSHLLSRSPQPRIGRSLRRRLVRAGLVDVAIDVLPWTWTSLADVSILLPFFDEGVPPESEIVPLDRRDDWFAALRRADFEGTLWANASVYVATGTVPAPAA